MPHVASTTTTKITLQKVYKILGRGFWSFVLGISALVFIETMCLKAFLELLKVKNKVHLQGQSNAF